MEYIALFFFAWMVVCLPAIIFTAVANSRRRNEISELTQRVFELTRQLEAVERRSHAAAPPASAPASVPAPVPTMRISAEEARTAAPAHAPEMPVRPPVVIERPDTTAVPPPPPLSPSARPPLPTLAPQAPAMAQQTPAQPTDAARLPVSVKPPVSAVAPPTPPPPAASHPVTPLVNKPATPPAGQPATPPAPMPSPPIPVGQVPQRIAASAASASLPPQAVMPGMRASAQVRSTSGPASFNLGASAPAAPAKKSSASLEEMIGTNWLPKLGIAIVVIGVGFLIAAKWGSFAPLLRVLIVYFGGGAMLAGGIFAERKERYQTLGRALIGGGWAVIVAVTYALRHAQAMAIVPSDALDLALLIGVIGAMVWHTLRYNSQLVTGASFLLGFAAITLNPDPPYNLIAGALLVTGMTVIVHRYGWWQLEVFGILASYLNHFYWLYTIFGLEPERKLFPHHTTSVLLVVAYWAVFRCSYVWRKVSSREEESVSTVAGLLNPLLFLGVMKYQSFHPEWAFYGLLGLGAAEFLLGQLPASRRRVAPFHVLSSLGAAFMVAAVPFKYSGNSLEILWLAGAEVFLLAGIFMRERLFRGFGLIISTFVVLYTLPYHVAPLAQELMNGQAHYHPELSIVLAAIAAVLYLNSNVIRARWPELFEEALESLGLKALSFAASLLTVSAIYACINDRAIAIVLALFITALTMLGRQFSIRELVYQAHWVLVAAFAQTISSGAELETVWNKIPERILIFAPVAGLIYLSSRYVRLSRTFSNTFFAAAYTWAATTLLAILIWLQAPPPWVALAWVSLAVLLGAVARLRKVRYLFWQTHLLSLLAAGWTLYTIFDQDYRSSRMQLLSVGLTAGLLYLLNRITNVAEGSEDERIPQAFFAAAYTWSATTLLTILIWVQAPRPWIAPAWIGLAVLLGIAARFWKVRYLLWQTHVLSLLAAGWTLYAGFDPQYNGSRVQLLSVGLTAGLFYLLNWITNVAGVIEDERIPQAYSWVGSLLVSWLVWYQVQPISVSLAWAIFGLLLFEIGNWRSWTFLRAQAYVALTCSFAHIFYSNFNVLHAFGSFGPEVITVVLLVPIYFWVYWHLHARKNEVEGKIRVEYLIACLGTATLAALARFELPLDSVVIGYAAVMLAALLAAWLTRIDVFLYQALVLLGVAAFRIAMHNFYHLDEAFSSNLSSAIWALGLMAAGIPVGLLIRARMEKSAEAQGWIAALARRPEQAMFFVPFALLLALLYLKAGPDRITLAWGAEALGCFVLGLWAKERSFRLAGLGLLLVCAAKIVFWDVWQMDDPTARYLTLIGVGALILLVSYLISRNREALREYL
jgi:hypothetical protein